MVDAQLQDHNCMSHPRSIKFLIKGPKVHVPGLKSTKNKLSTAENFKQSEKVLLDFAGD